MKQPVLLRVYEGGALKEIRQFTEQQIVIGRKAQVQIDLDSNQISPLHCIIEERDAGYYLTDLGSTNGTILHGEKILDVKIEPGDRFYIGPYEIEFFVGVPKPTAPPKQPTEIDDTVKVAEVTRVQAEVVKDDEIKELPEPPENIQIEAPKIAIMGLPPSIPVPPPTRTIVTAEDAEKNKDVKSVPGNLEIESQMIPSKEEKPQQVSIPVEVRSTTSPKEHSAAQDLGNKVEAVNSGIQTSRYRKKITFAPPSKITNLKDVIKPSKGTLVEVVVAWQERIIDTFHFEKRQVVRIGSHPKNDIVIPLVGMDFTSFPLIKLEAAIIANIHPSMDGEVIKDDKEYPIKKLIAEGKLNKNGSGYTLNLAQGELLHLKIGPYIEVYIRYVPLKGKPIPAPFLDLTATNLTNLVFSGVLLSIFALYMYINLPSYKDPEIVEEPLRKAIVIMTPPKPPEVSIPQPQETKKKIRSDDKVTKATQKKPQQQQIKKSGVAPEVANANLPKKKNTIVSIRPGGSKKTSTVTGKAGGPKKDVGFELFNDLGVGNNSKIDKVMKGSEGLLGDAQGVTGKTGFGENRLGDQLGTQLKDTGGGGKGTSTQGISDVGTNGGLGTGLSGKGTGGLGTRSKVDIRLGGSEEEFVGSIDREAIKRVIKRNINRFRYCYERELKKQSDLYGKIILQWEIVEGGRVRVVKVATNEMGNDQVAKCMVNHLKTLIFPEPPTDSIAEVKYPFIFQSQ